MEQGQPQPGASVCTVSVHGLAGQRAALPERRLDVHHPHDGRAQHRRRRRLEVAEPEDVRAGLQRGRRVPRDLVAPRDQRHRLARDDDPHPTPLRLTTSRVASIGRCETRSRIAPARVESLRGLIVAKPGRSPTKGLPALRTRRFFRTLRRPARRPGARNACTGEQRHACQHPSHKRPPCQAHDVFPTSDRSGRRNRRPSRRRHRPPASVPKLVGCSR